MVADTVFASAGSRVGAGIPAAALFDLLLTLDTHRQEEDRLNLFDWVMALPADLDPALAARAVLDYQSGHPGPVLSAPLHRLLDIVSQFSPSRLARFAGERRRSRLHPSSSFEESLI
ncbi:hypothetical protein FRZ61_05330 [Hypericibacter adhaerens]|uniref:Uncharacterized protein n=1 Tax=Hypericibacter adhaerens TaxID=2602016 RepID=A0A5J6MV45_9PROT|nr:hypothetical protein FRZ61_05330 [Hypericibacter adhaerens]